MPKESESCNKSDKNSSQIIVMPPPRVEEVLISDEEQQMENDPHSYEERLNAKLRDLDLYEEGMTIQQKEELIAVVVASWETAEKEKNRRQFYEEYMNAAEAFCNDEEIEFSFPEPVENSSEASILPSVTSCLDVSLSVDSTGVSNFSNEAISNSVKINKHFMEVSITDAASDSSFEACDNDAGCSKVYDEECFSKELKTKGRRKGRSKKGQGNFFRQAAIHPGAVITQLVEDDRDMNCQAIPNKHFSGCSLEQSMSVWKPCLSPKDTPLICSRRPWSSEEEKPTVFSGEDYAEKITNLVRDLDLAQNESKRLWTADDRLGRPFHLTRRVHFTKKSTKLDKYDLMMGVTEKAEGEHSSAEAESAAKMFAKAEPLSRTSGGAFHYVKSHPARLAFSHTDLEVRTTRSGLRYDVQATSSSSVLGDVKQRTTEVDFRTSNNVTTEAGDVYKQEEQLVSPLLGEVEVILDEKLVDSDSAKQDLCSDSPSLLSDHSKKGKGASTSRASSSKTKNHSAAFERRNHTVNSSCIDSDSSDCSSVIDVETIVDDEIEDFVLKRKMFPEYECLEKESNPPLKRLKKTAS